MKLKALPISKAKTAYGLLQDVKRAIFGEPKRVTMGCFIGRKDPDENGPACGTVGCFAGWVNILSGNRSHHADDFEARETLGEDLTYYLARAGKKHDTVGATFEMHDTFYVFNAGHGDDIHLLPQGTRRYAQAVVRRINRFIALNEKALRARKLRNRGAR
jgi:hypothetical protein